MKTKKQFTMVWYDEHSKSIETYTGTRDAIEDRLSGEDQPSSLILIDGVETDFKVDKKTVVTLSTDRTRKPRAKKADAPASGEPKRRGRPRKQPNGAAETGEAQS